MSALPRTTRRRTRLVPLTLGVALTVGALTGCQSSAPDLDAETAEKFQATVLTATQAVADGELQLARDTLTSFDTELEQAAADGSVSFARHKRIDAALTAVLADVDAAIVAATPPPEPEPVVTPAPVEPTAPVVDDGDDEIGDDEDDGPGNGNGNGNGPGKNKDKDKGPKHDSEE